MFAAGRLFFQSRQESLMDMTTEHRSGTAARPVGLVIRQKDPNNLEMPFDQLGDFITPTELFYIRSHFPTPELDLVDYRLSLGSKRRILGDRESRRLHSCSRLPAAYGNQSVETKTISMGCGAQHRHADCRQSSRQYLVVSRTWKAPSSKLPGHLPRPCRPESRPGGRIPRERRSCGPALSPATDPAPGSSGTRYD
jgi:hypothetical protein